MKEFFLPTIITLILPQLALACGVSSDVSFFEGFFFVLAILHVFLFWRINPTSSSSVRRWMLTLIFVYILQNWIIQGFSDPTICIPTPRGMYVTAIWSAYADVAFAVLVASIPLIFVVWGVYFSEAKRILVARAWLLSMVCVYIIAVGYLAYVNSIVLPGFLDGVTVSSNPPVSMSRISK